MNKSTNTQGSPGQCSIALQDSPFGNELPGILADQHAKDEATVTAGLQTFYEVGCALARIRDSKSYKLVAGFDTFEEYCRERWDMSRPYAYQKIGAAETVKALSAIADILPSVESQVRPLTSLTPADQQTAWKRALELANGKPMTAACVQAAVLLLEQETMTVEDRVIEAIKETKGQLMLDLLEGGKGLLRAFNGLEERWHMGWSVKEFDRLVNQTEAFPCSVDVAVLIQAAKFAAVGVEPELCVPLAYSMAGDLGYKARNMEDPVWKYFLR